MLPLVSINIATYNSARTLVKCLDSVRKQTYKNIEMIVMDSYSKDNTVSIASSYGAKILYASTLASARQVGAEASLGEYIFLLDSDQILDSDVIQRCVAVCQDEGYDGVTLFERSLITRNTFVERVIAYDKEIFHSLHDDDSLKGSAIPRFFRASLYKRIEFNKNPPITFEHTIIHHKIIQMGGRIKFIDAYIQHYETSTFWQVAKKFFRYGFYYIPALRRYPDLVIHHSAPRRTYFTVRAIMHPFLLLGLFILYGVKAVSTFCGILFYMFKSRC